MLKGVKKGWTKIQSLNNLLRKGWAKIKIDLWKKRFILLRSFS
uniref:Uncharacterized protein n=1 Tax=viral metagenome TaxID=1070528 RepID=A0A6C0HG81_9ZZZZ